MVGGDAVADDVAPAVGAEGVDVFDAREVDGLHERLHHVGDGARGFGLDFAAQDRGDDGGESGAEITGGEVVTGEEAGEVRGEFFGGVGASLLLGVVETEVWMAAGAWRAATAAIGEGELTQRCTILGSDAGT